MPLFNPSGGAHPDLSTHDALGLATDAELTTHAGAADPHTGYVLESLLDAKGDLIAASADNTPAKVTVGANNTLLQADSAQSAGVKWSAVGYGVTTGLAVSLTTASALATATTSISAATYADVTGVSVSLAAGTWLVMATCNGSSVNAHALMHVAITHSDNTVQVEGSQAIPASGSANVASNGNVHLAVILSPGSTTTYKMRAARGNTTLTGTWVAMDGAGVGVTNNLTDNTDKGTGIWAVRIA